MAAYPLRIDPASYDKVRRLAHRQGITMAAWLRAAVREKLARDA